MREDEEVYRLVKQAIADLRAGKSKPDTIPQWMWDFWKKSYGKTSS